MDNYNPNIHHRKSIRLKGYDYSGEGLYFITICVQSRKCLFGGIENGEMVLNNAGKIANDCWLDIPKHFPNAILHSHIVMPNHIHGIVELTVGVENFQPLHSPTPTATATAPSTPTPTANANANIFQRNEFQRMIPHSIGSIVKGFKTGVTKWFRHNSDIYNIWQRNYYEHIIRDDKSLQYISEYIKNNPKNWNEDNFFST